MRSYFLAFAFLFLMSCDQDPQFQSLDPKQVDLASKGIEFETETFILKEEQALLDILIVADTSSSMFHHLNQLGQSLKFLLSIISDYDWQLGITSADHGDHEGSSKLQQNWKDHIKDPYGRFGNLMYLEDGEKILSEKILKPEMLAYEKIFFHSLSHGSEADCKNPPFCHSHLEQPLRSLQSAIMKASLDNRSFFRPSADLVSIIITNEEERAEDRKRGTKAEQVIQTFNKIFGHLEKRFIAFNILVMDEACLKQERVKSPTAGIGTSIAELANLTGGANISLCNKDYGLALQQISHHIKNTLENTVTLKKEPIPETVEVVFEGEDLDWELSGREIVFKGGEGRVSVLVSYQSLE